MKVLILPIIAIILVGCASFTEPVETLEIKENKIVIERPKPRLPDPLFLKKELTLDLFTENNNDGSVMYCVDQKYLKNQFHNTEEYKRYLSEILLYLQALKEIEDIENKKEIKKDIE